MSDLLNATCEFLRQFGYLAPDQRPDSLNDIAVTSAIAKYQRFDANVELLAQSHNTTVIPDGKMGPVTAAAMQMPRCACPDHDFFEPLIGTGGWKNCNGASDYHRANVLVHKSGIPEHVERNFVEIITRCQKAFADIGLMFVFCRDAGGQLIDLLTDKPVTGNANIDFRFEKSSSWIGLAIVGNGNNQKCTSKIWCKYAPTYKPRDVVTQWVTLLKHELGHNCGLRHSKGGVMNPSIVNGLAAPWVDNDPSTKILKKWFGGEPVEIPGNPKPPSDGDKWPAVGQPIGEAFAIDDGVRAQLYRVFGA